MHILMVAKRREAEKQASSLRMSTQKNDIQNQFQINNGLVGDHSSRSSDYFGDRQNWNTGLGFYPPVSDPGLQDHLRTIGPDKLCNSILSRFETPALAFYATERYMGLHQYDGQVSTPSMCPSQYSYKEGSSADSGDKSDNFGIFRGSLNSFTSDNCYENSCRSLSIPCFGGKNHIDESRRVLGKDDASFQYHQDHEFGFISGEEKQSPACSSGGTVLASKTRIRWSQSLHEKFVECVNRLGGSDRATPKAILKMMDSDGLTIFHVKSHLQKYRVAKYMPDSSEGRTEKSVGITDVSQIDPKTGLQLREALQLQLDVQRSLHEQLEIQRNLQLRIEEQGKQLKIMFDQQQKSSNSQMKNSQNVDTASSEDHNLCIEDFEISTLDGSYNTHFHSKIS